MLTIHYQNSEVSSYLERLRARLGDLQSVFEDIGTTIESRVSARFETETDPLGRSWHPWAASTAQSYPRPCSKAGNARILDRYGDISASETLIKTSTSLHLTNYPASKPALL